MKIKRTIVEEITAHAKNEAPVEACGYLAGRDGIMTTMYRLTNIDRSSDHFSFDPKEQFTAARDARGKGLDIIAVYHSHPASPARPSDEDMRLAYDPALLYVIVSLEAGKEDIKAFEIKADEVKTVKLETIDNDAV